MTVRSGARDVRRCLAVRRVKALISNFGLFAAWCVATLADIGLGTAHDRRRDQTARMSVLETDDDRA